MYVIQLKYYMQRTEKGLWSMHHDMIARDNIWALGKVLILHMFDK